MRLRRMCERKKSGKLHVKESILEDFKAGGERRELLEIALLEALRDVGVDRAAHKQVKQTFNAKVELVKERFQEREKEITGQWLTPERMRSQLCYNERPGLKFHMYIVSCVCLLCNRLETHTITLTGFAQGDHQAGCGLLLEIPGCVDKARP